MQNKHLWKALKFGKLHNPLSVYNGLTKNEFNKTVAHLCHHLPMAENFVFDAEVDLDNIDEIWASLNALRECGLLRLPAPVCYFEMPHNTSLYDKDENWTANVDGHICAIAIQHDDHISLHSCQHIGLDHVKALPSHWDVAPFPMKLDCNNPELHIYHNDGWYKPENAIYEDFQSVVANKRAIGARAFYMVAAALVFLNTKWVVKQKVSQGLAKLQSRNKPSNGHTVIVIGRHGERIRDKSNFHVPHDRLKVRLHLRRGHSRQQPFGSGKILVKKIWIEPTLVGYYQEGVVLHDYRLPRNNQ